MPIYERVCNACTTRFSHLSKVEDRHLAVSCSNCGHEHTRKVLSPTATNFTFADKSARKGR